MNKPPVEIRKQMNATISAYRASWHKPEEAREQARSIVEQLTSHPWVRDQVPHDIERMARRDACEQTSGLPWSAARFSESSTR